LRIALVNDTEYTTLVQGLFKLGKDILEKSGRHFGRGDIIDDNKKYVF
jgi:hypothetical protein